MAKGTEILLEANPRGKFDECIISGTPSPGTCMELVPATEPRGGRFTYRAVSRADGSKGPVCVLMPDRLQGKLSTDAYVSGSRGFLYWPANGEELNMLFRYAPGTGTNNAEAIGDLLEIDGASGMLQAVGTDGGGASVHVSAPFQLQEHPGVAYTANTLVWTRFLGNNC